MVVVVWVEILVISLKILRLFSNSSFSSSIVLLLNLAYFILTHRYIFVCLFVFCIIPSFIALLTFLFLSHLFNITFGFLFTPSNIFKTFQSITKCKNLKILKFFPRITLPCEMNFFFLSVFPFLLQVLLGLKY